MTVGLILGVFALYFFVLHGREFGWALPAGKVAPRFAGKLLLAPDGTVWLAGFVDTGSKTKINFAQFLPGNDWVEIAGSEERGMGIKKNGSLWSWPVNSREGGILPATGLAAEIGYDRDWARVRCAGTTAVLLKTDGTLWHQSGKFINSNNGFAPLPFDAWPVQVGPDRDWSEIATSGFVHYAVKRDGTLWHWGNLVYRGPYVPTPALMTPEDGWERIESNRFSLVALKQSGSLWFGGSNAHVVGPDYWVKNGAQPFRAGPATDWRNRCWRQQLSRASSRRIVVGFG
jgi:hypothetical protein